MYTRKFRQRLVLVVLVGYVLHKLRVVFTDDSFPLLRQLVDILHSVQHITHLFLRRETKIGSDNTDGIDWLS